MEILEYNCTLVEIPTQDLPQKAEDCIIICKQDYVAPPKINTGEWCVMIWAHDSMNNMERQFQNVALFWELKDARLFCSALNGDI